MKLFKLLVSLAAYFIFFPYISVCGEEPLVEKKKAKPVSAFESSIQSFEKEDKKRKPPSDAIVFVGSSTIRFWKTINEDLAPLTIISRGFGGSQMADVLQYVDRIIIPYKPRAVVIYEGPNDIEKKVSPAKIAESFRLIAEKIHKELPETRIYIISIGPNIRLWSLWKIMEETNKLIEEECSKDKLLVFIKTSSSLFDSNGKPQKDLFQGDGRHLSSKGYIAWSNILKPILLNNELPFEPKKIEDKKEDPKK